MGFAQGYTGVIHMGIFTRGGKDVEEKLAELKRRLGALEDALEDLHAKHARLRGTVYAYRLHKPEGEEDAPRERPKKPREMSREELKRTLFHSGRFQPGKPAVHNDGD